MAARVEAPPGGEPGSRDRPSSTQSRRSPGSLLLRAGVALGWVLSWKLLTLWLYEQPVLSLLAGTSVTFVSAGALFGWIGIAVATLVQLAMTWLTGGLIGVTPWTSTAAYALAGALVYLVFRHVPGLRRDFETARTFVWFVGAAFVGAVIAPVVISAGVHTGNLLHLVALWSRSTIVTVWVFGPPLILLGRRFLAPALVPLEGEPRARGPRHVALVRATLPGETPQIVGVETREHEPMRDLLLGVLAVAAISGGQLMLGGGSAPAQAWWSLLYLVVLWWVARRLHLPGALAAAGFVAIGVLLTSTASLSTVDRFSDETLAIYAQILALWLVAALLGYAAEREGRLLEGLAELSKRLARDLHQVVGALTGAVEAKDEYTSGHLQRVQAFALDVGRRLGLSEPELELLQIASTLHDIGKIAVPESILNKPGPLDDQERAVIQKHPEIGARMLSRIDGLRPAAPLVLHHQERWDGRRDGPFPGYPAGLAGEQIPLGARIIAVVDSFDAMTTDRPYRRAMSADAAREVLRRERGRQFDPGVVDGFLELLENRPWQ